MSETTLHYRLLFASPLLFVDHLLLDHSSTERKMFKMHKRNVTRFKQLSHLTAPCGLKFCSSLLCSGGSSMRCLKERDRAVAICGIWNVKLLWNTIERSPSHSLICRASNQLRFRSLLNYFWTSQCFISGGAEVVCDFCQSLHRKLQAEWKYKWQILL
jgi:hypothetical protein